MIDLVLIVLALKACDSKLYVSSVNRSVSGKIKLIVRIRPPTDCGSIGSWAGISLNLTVTSNGVGSKS